MNEERMTNQELNDLRSKGHLLKNEVAYRVGDLIVAENVVTRERRVLETTITESTKRILKG